MNKNFSGHCKYILCSRKGIQMLVNLINISYCTMKLLPYIKKTFLQYIDGSVEEFGFALNGTDTSAGILCEFDSKYRNIQDNQKDVKWCSINIYLSIFESQQYYFIYSFNKHESL